MLYSTIFYFVHLYVCIVFIDDMCNQTKSVLSSFFFQCNIYVKCVYMFVYGSCVENGVENVFFFRTRDLKGIAGTREEVTMALSCGVMCARSLQI